MMPPLDLTFRDMTPSESVTAAVHRWVDRLGRIDDRIQHCTVVVERPHQSHRHGQQFHVRIELAVPDHTIAVARDPQRDGAHEDVYVAIADAFRAARRQLRDQKRIQRGEIKLHA